MLDIKLRSRIKDFLSHVWLIELIIAVLIFFYFGAEAYKYKTSETSKLFSAIEAIFEPKEYYMKNLKEDLVDTTYMVYEKTNSLEKLLYGNDSVREAFKRNFIDHVYTKEGYNVNPNILFIIRNKKTNEIVTNDPSGYFNLSEGGYTADNIITYINQKNDGKEIMVSYNNENQFSKLITDESVIYDKSVLANYEEYYYTSVDHYKNSANIYIVVMASILLVIELFILIKLIYSIIVNKGRLKLRGNFIKTLLYVFRYGFKYRQTRLMLIGLIVCSIIYFIFYLYMLAVGGTKNNILVTFFGAYPIKGSIVLMILPTIGFIVAVKKSIEIYQVNDNIKKASENIVESEIKTDGGPEIQELVESIYQIKNGYELAVESAIKDEKAKTELISNVSHDLRTPLTSIINYVNILKSGEITEEEREDYLKILDQKSKKLKVLIDDLFEMSKINSGKMELQKTELDIMSLIHQSVGEYSCLYGDKNIEFKVNSNEESIIIALDGKLVSRAIENLVINALKYSLDNTRVYIEVTDKEKSVGIDVKNIANYEMDFDNEEIFERFSRGDKSRNSKVEGSGLGLAITKSIVELHNGKIKISTEGDMFKIHIELPK